MFEGDKGWPGDPSYDSLYGGNKSGCYPDQEHFVLRYEGTGIVLNKATFTNAGCGNWNYYITDTWTVESMSTTLATAAKKGGAFTLKAAGENRSHTFRVSRDFKQSSGCLIVDLIK